MSGSPWEEKRGKNKLCRMSGAGLKSTKRAIKTPRGGRKRIKKKAFFFPKWGKN